MQILAYIFVYVFLFYVGIKFYFWGRKQEMNQLQMKWRRRLTLLFFFSPIIVFLLKLAPLPENVIQWVKHLLSILDYSLAWCETLLRPILGAGYIFTKPAITAFFYGLLGFLLGLPLDVYSEKIEVEKCKHD